MSRLEEISNIQWFPGHMTKTLRTMQSELKNVDIVVELLDSRIPAASKNPELQRISSGKPRLLILGKADMADADTTKRWLSHFRSLGYGAVAVSCREKRAAKQVTDAIRGTLQSELEALSNRGMAGARIRAMLAGVPNVGKSTLINCLAGSQRAKVEDRPGVTRGKQWITVPGIDLLDMPGVLWPKFENADTAVKLALTGAIKDEVLNTEELACYLLGVLRRDYPQALAQRYKLREGDLSEEKDDYELLSTVAARRGMLLPGAVADTERAAIMLLDEFRGCKLGRISLEEPGAW